MTQVKKIMADQHRLTPEMLVPRMGIFNCKGLITAEEIYEGARLSAGSDSRSNQSCWAGAYRSQIVERVS
jgi:hypothetical protein